VQQLQIVSLIIRADVIFAQNGFHRRPSHWMHFWDALLLAPAFYHFGKFLTTFGRYAQLDQRMRSAQITARRYCDISALAHHL